MNYWLRINPLFLCWCRLIQRSGFDDNFNETRSVSLTYYAILIRHSYPINQ